MRKVIVKPCRECGKPFKPKDGCNTQQICSAACRLVRMKRARIAWLESREGRRWWKKRLAENRKKRRLARREKHPEKRTNPPVSKP